MSDQPETAPVDERAVLVRQLEAIIAMAEAGLLLIRGKATPVELCQHPPEQRKYVGSEMGDDRFLCLACSQIVLPAQPAHKE